VQMCVNAKDGGVVDVSAFVGAGPRSARLYIL